MSDVKEWMTARSRRKRYGRFTLHQVDSIHEHRTYCGNMGVEVRYRTPAEMLNDNLEPCGHCWNWITWDMVKAETGKP